MTVTSLIGRDAIGLLRSAALSLSGIGAQAWAERARAELVAATGGA